MALTHAELKAIQPEEKSYTLADEKGLYVDAFPTGGSV